MPVVVMPQPSGIAAGLAGIAGAATGASEAAAENEKKRQFDESLKEQKLQSRADISLRIAQLEAMKREGLLSREHEARLEVYKAKNGMTALGAENVQQTSERLGAEAQERTIKSAELRQQDIDSTKVKKAADYATFIREQGQKQEYALGMENLRGRKVQTDAWKQAATMVDVNDPKNIPFVEEFVADAVFGPNIGGSKRDPNAEALVKAWARTATKDSVARELEGQVAEVAGFAAAKRAGESGEFTPDSISRPQDRPVALEDITMIPSSRYQNRVVATDEVSEHGEWDVSPGSILYGQNAEYIQDIDLAIIDAAGQAAVHPYNKKTIFDSGMGRITESLKGMKFSDPAALGLVQAEAVARLYDAIEISVAKAAEGAE